MPVFSTKSQSLDQSSHLLPSFVYPIAGWHREAHSWFSSLPHSKWSPSPASSFSFPTIPPLVPSSPSLLALPSFRDSIVYPMIILLSSPHLQFQHWSSKELSEPCSELISVTYHVILWPFHCSQSALSWDLLLKIVYWLFKLSSIA